MNTKSNNDRAAAARTAYAAAVRNFDTLGLVSDQERIAALELVVETARQVEATFPVGGARLRDFQVAVARWEKKVTDARAAALLG